MTFFYKTLPRKTFYTRFNFLKRLKIWRCHFIDENHMLIKLANERTIMDLDILDPNTRNQLPSQVAFFVLYSIVKGEILAISENHSANLCDVMINFQHYIEFSSHPDSGNGWPLCSIQSKASKERFRNQIETAKFGSPEEAIKRILWQLPPPAQGNSVSPYLRRHIFSFDDKYICSQDKLKSVPESPLKFFCRCCRQPCFKLGGDVDDEDIRAHNPKLKNVSYIFHPFEPFAMSLGRHDSQELFLDFHFYNP